MSGGESITACPLTWPRGRLRTPDRDRQHARFGERWTVASATKAVLEELKRLGVDDWNVIISTNVELRRDGLPRSVQRRIDDPGVAVYFRLDNEPHVLACDRWLSVAHNLRAVAKHVEALRGLDRWGVGTLKEAFAGYKALPESTRGKPWREVLGNCDTADDVNRAWRALAREQHPDRGGSVEQMAEINRARDDALREIGS